jgi:hypothetical protein
MDKLSVTVYCNTRKTLHMRKLPKRDQRRRTAQAVVSGSEGIIVPLNYRSYSKRTEELIDLVKILQKIEIAEVQLEREGRRRLQQPTGKSSDSLLPPLELYKAANGILSACSWSPRVSPPPGASQIFRWKAPTERTDWENQFVLWLLGLRARREICLIRRCRSCEAWFYAVTNHQAYCSDYCRQQFHAKSESFKEKRRLYMRRFRQTQKLRDSSAVELLRAKSVGRKPH